MRSGLSTGTRRRCPACCQVREIVWRDDEMVTGKPGGESTAFEVGTTSPGPNNCLTSAPGGWSRLMRLAGLLNAFPRLRCQLYGIKVGFVGRRIVVHTS